MNRGVYLLFLAAISLLGFSCKAPRDGTTVVEGQVVDRHTGAIVADATVSVMQSKTQSTNSSYSHKQDVQAGSDGRFSFSFEGDGDYSYILMASTPLGHYTWWQEAPAITSGRKNKDLKVKAQAPAWVKVNLVDEEPKDTAWVYMNGITNPGEQMYILRDTSVVRTVQGGVTTIGYFRITTLRSLEVSFFRDFFVQSLDTALLEIKF